MATRAKRGRDPIDYHDVMIALSKARAASVLLDVCAHGSDYLHMPTTLLSAQAEADVRDWIRHFAQDALDAALDEAEAAFRESLTPEEAREQVIGAVADGA
jgi:hypothetical protein